MLRLLALYHKLYNGRIHRLSVEGTWIIAGQVSSVIGALVLVRVLTEYLEPNEFGGLALGLTLAGLVNQVVMGGITAGIGRYYSIAAEKEDLGGYFCATRYLLAYTILSVFIIGLIIIISLNWLGYSRWVGLAVATLVLSVLSGYNSVLSGIQNAARQRAIVACHSGLEAWLKVLLALAFVLYLGASSKAVVIGYICSSFLITVSQLIFLRCCIPRQRNPTENNQQWITQIWRYSLPFSSWGAFTWLQQVSDRWALQSFATTSDVGQYAVLFQMGFTPTALLTGMVISFLGPILYQHSGDASNFARNIHVHRLGWRIAYLCLIITIVGFAIVFFLHQWMFSLLVASEYRGSSYLLPWVVLAGGIFATGQVLALKLMSEMKPSTMTTAKIVTALIGVVLNISGAAFAGVEGVVCAMVGFSSIYFMWMAMLANRSLVK